MTDIISKIGQLFLIGFPDVEPSSTFLNFIAEEDIGGVILFKKNCPTHETTKNNIDLIKSSYKQDASPFIAVDQEGGRVCRIMGAPAEYQSPTQYAVHYSVERFREDYERAAVFMESLGINLNLAPTCDIYLNNKNLCLKDRCFGHTADMVIPFVKAAVGISTRVGLLSCLKHFPGLGIAAADPHQALPTVDYDELVWQQREKRPFAAGVECGADMIMTTHLRVPKLDDKIVTGSQKIVSELLRKQLAFDGPVITDDLTMKGADCLGHIGERTVAAFKAGHDLLLFGQDIDASMEAYEYFRDALMRGEISKERVTTSLDRVAGIKFKLGKSVTL